MKVTSKLALKEFLEHAKNQGLDTEYVATNKETVNFWNKASNVVVNTSIGIAKCYSTALEVITLDTTLPSVATDIAIKTYGSKGVKKLSLWGCIGMEVYDNAMTQDGVDLAVKTVDLLGDE